MKRSFDFLLAFVGLIALSIPLLIISVLVRYNLGKPIFFKNTRPGLHGKPFELIKFRTMTNDRDENGEWLPDEERMTRFGEFLRSTSIDELPELWNVLRGDMSLVGPRPLLMEYLPLYTEEQARRHTVLPGITGWAQINGRNLIDWDEKFALDLWYIDNRNFLLDMKILWLTIRRVLKREGIYAPGEVIVQQFKGSAHTKKDRDL